MNNLHEPTHGHVEIDGVNVTRAKGEELRRLRRDKVSMVFQHFALLPHRTVRDNVAYPLEVAGVPPGRAAILGDQIFTDCLAAKRLGMKAYIVPPIKDKKNLFFRFKRLLEKPFLRAGKQNRKEY